MAQTEGTYDFILAKEEWKKLPITPLVTEPVDEEDVIVTLSQDRIPPLSVANYSYRSIPKCYHLMKETALEVSGILAVQNQPGLSLTGNGVLIGIADTGIDYTNPLFWNRDGGSRIVAIWDQTQKGGDGGKPPEGYSYGTEYAREDIEAALGGENPYERVPTRDTDGHGTYLAGVAAGGKDEEENFIGGAPEAELVIVKLRQAQAYLREYFYEDKNIPVYQENDIMTAVTYLDRMAEKLALPMVILLGVGTNQGSHTGTDPLSEYLNRLGRKNGRVLVVPTGNQAIARQHFYGEANNVLQPVEVEINVESKVDGFCMELWAYAPEQLRIVLQSPTGQRSPEYSLLSGSTQQVAYVFENTGVTIDYRIVGRESGDMLIFFRFREPAEGIWTLLVYPEYTVTGAFHLWLPVSSRMTFIQPDPDNTLTVPSVAPSVIAVGGYDGLNNAAYIASGRGYVPTGGIKPELAAPAVDVYGPGLRQNYVQVTGTSAAAAVTAGAGAQALQWGIGKGNVPGMNSVEVKNFLIRGADREEEQNYPNKVWGFGTLQIYQSFDILRK